VSTSKVRTVLSPSWFNARVVAQKMSMDAAGVVMMLYVFEEAYLGYTL
jgi:hypothetical protein